METIHSLKGIQRFFLFLFSIVVQWTTNIPLWVSSANDFRGTLGGVISVYETLKRCTRSDPLIYLKCIETTAQRDCNAVESLFLIFGTFSLPFLSSPSLLQAFACPEVIKIKGERNVLKCFQLISKHSILPHISPDILTATTLLSDISKNIANVPNDVPAAGTISLQVWHVALSLLIRLHSFWWRSGEGFKMDCHTDRTERNSCPIHFYLLSSHYHRNLPCQWPFP